MINKNNKAENSKRVEHLYKEGAQVLLKKGTKIKYETPYQGPFCILKVNDNGTVCLKIGAVEDTYNIKRLPPYTSANDSNHGGECSMWTNKLRRSSRERSLAAK